MQEDRFAGGISVHLANNGSISLCADRQPAIYLAGHILLEARIGGDELE
jgi:hypothetical protein